jgi:PPOX class probable F420-dependent enzyme
MPIQVEEVITPDRPKAFTVGQRSESPSLGELDPVYRSLLETPVTASVSTISADGTPQVTPNWCEHDGTHLILNSVRGRLKDRNLRARSHVTVLLLNPQNPYHWMTIYGHVVETIDEDDPARGHLATESIDRLSQKYLNTVPYPLRDAEGEIRVLYKVRPDRIQTFGKP